MPETLYSSIVKKEINWLGGLSFRLAKAEENISRSNIINNMI